MSEEMDGVQYANQFVKDSLANLNKSGGYFEQQTVIPGDNVTDAILSSSSAVTELRKTVAIGDGLTSVNEGQVLVTMAGILSSGPKSTFSVQGSSSRYFPKIDDQVVGIIEDRGGDYYMVNCFSGKTFLLNRLAFEGATKRNKPELNKGDIVYARVMTADKYRDPELTCEAKNGPKKEWTTGETIFGELSQGLVLRIATGKSKQMLLPDCTVLNALGKYFAFEVAVGVNGAIWFRGVTDVETVVIRNAILNSELLDDAQTIAMVDKLAVLAKKLQKRKADSV